MIALLEFLALALVVGVIAGGVVVLARAVARALRRRAEARHEALVQLWNAVSSRDIGKVDAWLAVYGPQMDKATVRATEQVRAQLFIEASS